MHREFEPDQPFEHRSNIALYFLTALVLLLVFLDLWQPIVSGVQSLFGWQIPGLSTREWYGFRFALIAAVIGGARTLYSSLERAMEGRIGADLAVAIACIAAILLGEPLIAAEVIVISLIGECLEAITFDRTQNVLRKLVELFPIRTWILQDGQEVRVLVSDLSIGDRVLVKPGGKVPVDGVVIDGQSAIDTSALTGESLPRDVGPGDRVLAGSLVVNGSVTIETQKVSKQTVAGQVIELTARALKEKAPLERYADRLAKQFLPAVLGLALLTFGLHLSIQYLNRTEANPFSFAAASRVALYPTLAVLVVACPCALVLATPAAIMAAIGRLAGTGVLLKSGAAIERLASIESVAFDKTGTLTEGKLILGDLIPGPQTTPDELLRIAANLEQKSEHPLARVVCDAARRRGWEPTPIEEFENRPGQGVLARWDGSLYRAGTWKFLNEEGIESHSDSETARLQLDASGQSAVFLARDDQYLGAIGARDGLRPEAIGVLSELADMGLSLSMLTGDRETVAKTVARDLPPITIHAEQLPSDKARLLPERCAYVGDGVNDAPALVSAHVGLAVGSGTEIAADAGDIVLMSEPLRPLPFLIRLSRETIRIIRQNIVWFGFGVNIVGILITGLLWPLFAQTAEVYEQAPIVGVIYHQIGSLLVLLNSMRLLTFERAITNSTLLKVQDRYRSLDRWLNTVHLDDFVHFIERHSRRIVLGITGAGLVAWFASGLTQIAADEVGVTQRFGAPVRVLEPGLHLRWPWLIEKTTRIKPNEIKLIELGFRSLNGSRIPNRAEAREEQRQLLGSRLPGITDRDLTWSSGHSSEIARLTDESLMITGDGNLIELLATVRYSISSPRDYLFQSRDPEAIIRAEAESVLREQVAGQVFLDLLTAERTQFQQRVTQRLIARLSRKTSNPLGIQIEGLTIHDLHPPQEVVASYHAVAEAIQKRDRLINEAEADAIRLKRRMQEEALRIERQAESGATKTVADAAAERDAFRAWYLARTQLSDDEQKLMQKEADERIQKGEDRQVVQTDLEKRRDQILRTRRDLTEFRLTLAVIGRVLSGRDKIVLDVSDLPSKRHLFLMDPEGFKLPAGLLRPAENNP